MGSANAVKDHIRSAAWEMRVEIFWRDLWYGVRTLVRSPGFAAIAVLTLALGIGANTAIFQLLDAVRLRHLPVIGESGGLFEPLQLAPKYLLANAERDGEKYAVSLGCSFQV